MADKLIENLCPIYQNLLAKTFLLIEYAETSEEMKQISEDFCEKYFLLPQFKLWKLQFWNKYRPDYRLQHVECPEKVDTKSIFLYYYLKFYESLDVKNINFNTNINLEFLRKSANYETTLEAIETSFDFPHRRLKGFYQAYVNYGSQPVTPEMKKNYEKNLSLLKKFEKACDDDTEWLKCLKQLENEESVIANIELRLGSKKSCTNKDIWKHYIEYLRDRNPVAMLEVYLRYCRFFISDKQMLKNYRIEIERVEKLQAVSIFWVDTIEWELEFGDLKTAHTLLSKITGNESVIPELTTKENFANVLNKYKIKKSIKQKFIPKKLLCEENSDFIMKLSAHFGIPSKFLRIEKPEPCYFKESKFYQSFSIPTFMAKYITNNANSALLSKLHQSSKYFFSTLPIPVCHRLVIQQSVLPRYFQQSLFLKSPTMNFLREQKLYLSNSLLFCSNGIETNFSKFISKFYKCDAIHISICNLTITEKQLEFLVKSGNVKYFQCRALRVLDEKNRTISYNQIQAFIESFGNKLENISFYGGHDYYCL